MKSISDFLTESITVNEGRSIMSDASKFIKRDDMDSFVDYMEGVIDEIERKVNSSIVVSVYGIDRSAANDCVAIVKSICADIRGNMDSWRDDGSFSGYEEDALADYANPESERIDNVSMDSDVDDDELLSTVFGGWSDLVKKVTGKSWN